MCGDGICESPFEFASYGRFGCRADCGRLSDVVENLTTLQINLAYNFDHPVGSLPQTELMTQASWNLCPENGAPHGARFATLWMRQQPPLRFGFVAHTGGN